MNKTPLNRRKFITTTVGTVAALTLGDNWLLVKGAGFSEASSIEEPLFDWSLWNKYRKQVNHPVLTIQRKDIAVAKANMQHYAWAKNYAGNIEKSARFYLHLANPDSLKNLIEETTPGDPLWTPCPACRDQGKPVHPHGLWNWDIQRPDELECTMCGTVFPNDGYPEDVVLQTTWGKPQQISFCGGEPFVIFGFKTGRPSFTANIRSRKVQWCAQYSRTLAEAYTLSGNPGYAVACRQILLRLAVCYPNWLVHVGYGEYADMDPRTAALHINSLPEAELTPPPNKADKRLWTGYWSAGRASGVGLESDFVRKVVEAYDLTCTAKDKSGQEIYTETDRLQIERDLLLESTILLVSDKKINNKSVSNRTATGLVGMCVGHPGLVRFGLEGFELTVNDWFLPDGTTSETPFYGLMTLGGIWDFAQAARAYSDPAGYLDQQGKRIDNLDLYHDTSYEQVWEAFFLGLQGDLTYPPYADSFRQLPLDAAYVELMVANYPERKKYLSLLKELCGSDLSVPAGPVPPAFYVDGPVIETMPTLTLPYDLAKPICLSSFSLFYRMPTLGSQVSPPYEQSDWCPPSLRIGHMRTGVDGREGLLLLSASHFGVHHEQDSLNLYYWKKGKEILSDLGYLWDHPLKPQTIRTVAHHTVVIDEKNQRTKERGGEVHFFKTSEHVKVMEASSKAYAKADLYRRTSAIIDHGNGQNYVVDFFRVDGGQRQDYVFHGSTMDYEINQLQVRPSDLKLYDFKNIRTGESPTAWNMAWKAGGKMKCIAWSLPQRGEEVFLAEGWGQRDWKNADIGATIPYVVRRCQGGGTKTFVSVFEGYDTEEPFVRKVSREQNGSLVIDTAIGRDYIFSALDEDSISLPPVLVGKIPEGRFVVASVQNNKIIWSFGLSLKSQLKIVSEGILVP